MPAVRGQKVAKTVRKPAVAAKKAAPVAKAVKAAKPTRQPAVDPLGRHIGMAPNDPGFQIPDKRMMSRIWRLWSAKEQKILGRLDSPAKIQEYLDSITYDPADTLFSVRETLRTGRAHCFGSALLAYYALSRLGYECALLGFDAVNDDGHAICVFRERGAFGPLFGAVSKSNYTTLRSRDCVYASLRELVMSYFDFHFNLPRGEKTMTEWMGPFNAWDVKDPKFGWAWLFSDQDISEFEDEFDKCDSYPVLLKSDDCRKEGAVQSTTSAKGKRFMLATKQVIKATKLGGNPAGFKRQVAQ